MLANDLANNKAIGKNGAEWLLSEIAEDEKVSVLTHCNTGSLATSGWGTALGIIRHLHEINRLEHVYWFASFIYNLSNSTETRPFNHGGRLTAYELLAEKIPSTLICDSMASALLQSRKIAAIIVGADRVAKNGDNANKNCINSVLGNIPAGNICKVSWR
jgi:methylthioribose-1-phosphate isomerase